MKKENPTRERIVECAIALFNARGAHSVTTNHIAEELGMSPGNLYYHYRNKQEIIRDIFARITVRFAEVWSLPEQSGPSAISSLYEAISEIYFSYRFFYLELPSLVAQDEILRKEYIANQSAKREQISQVISGFVSAGLMKSPADERELQSWIDTSWIINDFWLSYLAVSGRRITREGVQEGVVNFFYFIKPALTKKGLSAFFPPVGKNRVNTLYILRVPD